MKKLSVCLMACVCLLGLVGCGSKEEEVEKKEFYAINEAIELEGATVTLTNVTKSEGSNFDKPKDGMEYVIVEVSITNTGEKEVSYNPYDFRMQNSQGQIESQSFSIVDSDTKLSSGKLAAGGSISGTIVFEQPVGDSDLTLIYKASFFSGDEYKIKLQ